MTPTHFFRTQSILSKNRRKVIDSLNEEEDYDSSNQLLHSAETNILGRLSPTLSPVTSASKVPEAISEVPKLRVTNSSTEEGRQRKAVRKIRSNSLVQTDV